MFGTSDDYHQMNGGAHRKRATNFDAPAVIWHLAFWLEAPYSESVDVPAPASYKAERQSIKATIDKLIIAICKIASGMDGIRAFVVWPNIFDKIILFESVYDGFTYNEICNAATADRHLTKRQKDILISDNRVVSLKFMWHSIGMTLRFEIHTEYMTITTYAENIHKISDRHPRIRKEYQTLVDYMNGDESLWEQTKLYWYRTFWNDYAKFTLSRPEISEICKDAVFKRVFADFRGLVLSDEVVVFPDAAFFEENKRPTWGHEAQKRALPIVAPKEIDECTVSYMLNGRALYMTALGPQRPESRDDDRIPVEYLLYIHQRDASDRSKKIVNRWQAGRLVDRIHRLGTVRLASLKELSQLRTASSSLAGLGGRVKRARDAVEGGESDAIRHIEDAHRYFNNITTEFNRETKTASGLLYRIERSRYYVEQFMSNVQILGIERVSGYQKYDEFIERRLGSNFDFVDRLGKRYERAVQSLTLLDQNYLTIKTNMISEKAAKVSEKLLEIQIYAELFLLSVLVPYYISSLLEHISLSNESLRVLTVLIWTVFFGASMFKFSSSQKKLAFGRGKAAMCSIALLALLLSAIWADQRFARPGGQGTHADGHVSQPAEAAPRPDGKG